MKIKQQNQMKTLIQTILPRIALYKALKEEFDEEKVYQHMQKYMSDIVAKQKHNKKSFDVTMKKCLWHTACVENDCAELCHLFCDVDNVTYGELKKICFKRTKTLGYDGDCCDFHFYKK